MRRAVIYREIANGLGVRVIAAGKRQMIRTVEVEQIERRIGCSAIERSVAFHSDPAHHFADLVLRDSLEVELKGPSAAALSSCGRGRKVPRVSRPAQCPKTDVAINPG